MCNVNMFKCYFTLCPGTDVIILTTRLQNIRKGMVIDLELITMYDELSPFLSEYLSLL